MRMYTASGSFSVMTHSEGARPLRTLEVKKTPPSLRIINCGCVALAVWTTKWSPSLGPMRQPPSTRVVGSFPVSK
jgi:hypothetical protein